MHYTVPPNSMSWYMHSLSYALHRVAQSGKGVFTKAFTSELEKAGESVFAHESRFNGIYASANVPDPNPMFVYDGYLAAVRHLSTLACTLSHELDDGYIYGEMDGHLRGLLYVAYSRCTSNLRLSLATDKDWNVFLADFTQMLKP